MNTQERDPIFASLDRLAGLADTDVVADRMPAIQRRVRVARQRKAAGLAAAAVVLAVGGAAVWQGLPSERSEPPPVTDPTPWQDIAINAEPRGADHVRISYTVTGESSTYSDSQTGEPIDYAGPRNTDVLVDGKVVSGSDGGDISCEPGGVMTPYTMEFGVDKPLVVPVHGVGEHTIEVKAPYCADGTVVENSQRVVVTTVATGFTLGDQLTTDLDGDGIDEVIRIRVPNDVDGDQELQVVWGTSAVSATSLANSMEHSIFDPVDLDGDGDRELIIHGGGGETSLYSVFLADTDNLEQVRTVDSSGKELLLSSPGEDLFAWHVSAGPDGIISYKLIDPESAAPPAPVRVREWTLSGNTLTQAAGSVSECVLVYTPLELGPC
jgi:hypothetical protein